VQTTSFIAFLGATTLAVGMSLQGSLANLAGGILILFFKPFKVGDEIEALTKRGVIDRIEIFYTSLKTPEGDTIIMPNGALSNGVIINYSKRG
jgi:small conductance mechanosensitive channel